MRKLALVISLILILTITAIFTGYAQENRGQGVVKIKVEEGKQVDLYEGSYALIIGVSQYQQGSGWSSLSGVKDDVIAVESTLIKQGFQVSKVLNPTGSTLRQSIDKFIDDYGFNSNNRLLIYYAGHGYTGKAVDGRELGYIVPMDAPDPDKMAVQFNRVAISMKEIINYAERIQSKHALFLFDSCFSGTLFKSRERVPLTITSKIAKPVRQFITAGDANQPVPDQSQFRRQFIAALEGEADLNKDGYVTGSELGLFLEEKVTDYSNRAQTPQWGKINNPDLNLGDFVFPLSKSSTNPSYDASVSTSNPTNPATGALDASVVEQKYWDSVDKASIVELKAYLQEYKNGKYASLAKAKISSLETTNNSAANSVNTNTTNPANSKINEDVSSLPKKLDFTETIKGLQINQDQSLIFRDRCRYQQQVRTELYKKGSNNLDKVRSTTVIIGPSTVTDATGALPVLTQVVADTDDKGNPKSKVDPNARLGIASGAFLDLLFFPLLPEKIPYYNFEELASNRSGERLIRFSPKPGVKNVTLASGEAYLSPTSGAVLTIKVNQLHNLEAFDKILKDLEQINAVINFAEFDNKFRMPVKATITGSSDINGFRGNFKVYFEESNYIQVLADKKK